MRRGSLSQDGTDLETPLVSDLLDEVEVNFSHKQSIVDPRQPLQS